MSIVKQRFYAACVFQDLTKEIVGDSRVVYDDRKIVEGNFTRKFSVYENDFLDDAIDVTVQNKMLPLGVRYLHRVNNESHAAAADSPNVVRNELRSYSDTRRIWFQIRVHYTHIMSDVSKLY